MSGFISDEQLRQIRERVALDGVVGRYLSLTRKGNALWGCCPFHHEKTPSFKISPDLNFYKCFGCGVSGDVFKFVMEIEGLTFPEAAAQLAREAGIEIKPASPSPRARQHQLKRERLLEINDAAASYFQLVLSTPAGAPARAYLDERAIDRDFAKKWCIGFAGDDWQGLANHLREQGFAEGEVLELGLCGKSDAGRLYDRFRARLMFPIRDVHGRVVGFGGRVFRGEDKNPERPTGKYFNSSESEVYTKSRVLYGLYESRRFIAQERAAILVEGYFDVMRLAQAGIEGAVATCGTALTLDHIAALQRRADKVYLVFDADDAGRNAAIKAARIAIAAGTEARMVETTPGDDPDSFVRREGPDEFRRLLETAYPAMQLLIRHAQRHGVDAIEGRLRAFDEIKPVLAAIADRFARDLYVREVAAGLRIPEGELRLALGGTPAAERGQGLRVVESQPLSPLEECELTAAEIVLKYRQLKALLAEPGVLDSFVNHDVAKMLGEALAETSDDQPVPADGLLRRLEDQATAGLLFDRLMKDDRFPADVAEDALKSVLLRHRRHVLRHMLRTCNANLVAAIKNRDNAAAEAAKHQRAEVEAALRHVDNAYQRDAAVLKWLADNRPGEDAGLAAAIDA